MVLVRPTIKSMGLDGTMRDGPWSYRIGSLVMISPVYACILITLGTLSGRHLYFANMGRKILGRFVPRGMRERIVCPPGASKAMTTATAATTTTTAPGAATAATSVGRGRGSA